MSFIALVMLWTRMLSAEWSTINVTLPRVDSGMAIGYYNDSIHLIGVFTQNKTIIARTLLILQAEPLIPSN